MSDSMYVPPEAIGRMLADAYDEQQGAALNEFGRLLRLTCKGTPRASTQLAYAADKLNADGQWLVKELADYLRVKDERS